MSWSPTDELPHEPSAGAGGVVDEWIFVAWTPDGGAGVISGHRVLGARAWYWSALVQEGWPLLHLAEWDVAVRSDPFVVKAPEMWAEHHCVAPFEQWSIGNEAHFVALDDPDDALGRAYGTPTPMAADLEWYATGDPQTVADGFEQAGVVHGLVELLGRPDLALDEASGHRWRRWTADGSLEPIELPPAVAHTGLRAPFAFPDGTVADWVLSRRGWCRRARR